MEATTLDPIRPDYHFETFQVNKRPINRLS